MINAININPIPTKNSLKSSLIDVLGKELFALLVDVAVFVVGIAHECFESRANVFVLPVVLLVL